MLPKRFRIIDLIAAVGLAALGAILGRGGDIHTYYGPIGLICPIVVSAALIAFVSATIAARFGRAARRPFWWGFAFIGWTYLAISVVHSGFDSRLQPRPALPLPSLLFNRAMEDLGEYARTARWTSAVEAARYLCFIDKPGPRG